ncbi:MAG: hypothetical protein ACI4RD_06985 [Kiritimatiellia bacterium]
MDVAKGEELTASEAVVIAPEARGLIKTGEGQYNLPADKLYFDPAKNLKVGAGQLGLSLDKSGETPAFATPTEALDKALIWFDASKKESVISSDGAELADSVNVEEWLDVRETGNAVDGYQYTRAVTMTNVFPESGRMPWYAETDGGRAAISFGLARDGRYMAWINPDGSTHNVKRIYHFFAVYGVVNTHGYILGSNTNSTYPGGGPNDSLNGSIEDKLWSWGSAQTRARNFINGVQINAYAEMVHKGFHLLEVAYANSVINGTGTVNCFFNDRNLDYLSEGSPNKETYAGHRVGGDYLSEVLVFDRMLTEEERIGIELYLMQKWNLGETAERRNLGVATAANATLGVSLETGNDGGDVELVGIGTIRKPGADDLYLQPGLNRTAVLSSLPVTPMGSYQDAIRAMLPTSGTEEFEGAVRIENGAMYLNMPVALAVEAKDTIAAEIVKASGNKVTVANTGDDGTVKKTGNGIVVVDALDEGVEKMIVDGGTLVLKSPKKAAADTVMAENAGVEVAIANPGFEEVVWQDEQKQYRRIDNSTYNGWTGVGAGTEGNAIVLISGVGHRAEDGIANTPVGGESTYAFDYHLPPPHSGKAQLAIIGKTTSAYTTIDIPVDGIYDISFWTATGTWGSYNKKVFDVVIEDEDGTETAIGRFSRKMDDRKTTFADRTMYREVCFKTPFLKAGAGRKLWFKVVTDDQNAAVTIDDVRMVLSPDTIASGTVSLPNGDLEDVPYETFTNLYANSVNNTAKGWELEQGASWEAGQLPRVAVVSRATTDYTDSFDYRKGEVMLCFRGAGGKATLKSATIPAGTYNLCGVLGARRDTDDTIGSTKLGNATAGTIEASVTINGETTSLGAVSQDSRKPTRAVWPNAFTVTEATTVDFVLSLTTDSVVLADDFELCPPKNLIACGGFNSSEELAGWVVTQTYDEELQKYWGTVAMLTYNSAWDAQPDVAKAYFEGTRLLAITRNAAIAQEVTLAKAGRYRLTLHQFARENEWYEVDRLNIFIKGEDGAERLVGSTCINGDNVLPHQFMRMDFDFAIETAGKWTIIVRGSEPTNASVANTILLDDISLVAIDDGNYEATPRIPKTTKLEIAAGAKLHLDYPGVLELRSVKFGRRTYNHGTYNAANMGEYISGTGSIYIRDKGARIVVR